jgi:hypothetical protein
VRNRVSNATATARDDALAPYPIVVMAQMLSLAMMALDRFDFRRF